MPTEPEEKERVAKMIVENPEFKIGLVDKITKVYPDIKKDDLIKLETKDLLEISLVLGFNPNEINKIRAPENATKETKELATNLDNIRR
jgi:hypothetical protein